jgi:hypothetical protein
MTDRAVVHETSEAVGLGIKIDEGYLASTSAGRALRQGMVAMVSLHAAECAGRLRRLSDLLARLEQIILVLSSTKQDD